MAAPGPIAALVDEVGDALGRTLREVARELDAELPPAYAQDLGPEIRRQHLAAIVGARATGVAPNVTLRSADGNTWTIIRPDDRPGLLSELLAELPDDLPLHTARVYTARSGHLAIDVFGFGAPARPAADDPAFLAKRAEILDHAAEVAPDLPPEVVDRYLHRCAAVFVDNLSPRRLVRFARMVAQVEGTDDVAVDAWLRQEEGRFATVTLVAGGSTPRRLFERAAWILGLHGLSVRRAYLDPLAGGAAPVALCTFVVTGTDDDMPTPGGPGWQPVERDLLRVRWLDERCLVRARATPWLGLPTAEVLVALLDLVHVRLARRDPFAFSRQRLAQLADAALELAAGVAEDLLRGTTTGREAALQARPHEDVRAVLGELVAAVEAVQRSNLDRTARYGLALALDPAWLLGPEHTQVPFAVLYGHGDGYRGFHVRFRPIARGGLRVVAPRTADQHALETERHFDEVYGLAFAQELKNKDIPEGGAKGVLLVEPGASVDGALHALTDGLLDLALATPGDLLFLGPDENVTPAHIEWIVARAVQRGYPQPLALMSSKPGAGINHKRYGVTSEGVAVFLDAGLRALGHPADAPFRVVLTGGPDGDVAGNTIRILRRDHGSRVRFVGIADGSGSALDPDGLDIDELMRLVDAELPIVAFDPARLGPQGSVASLDDPGGLARRNGLHAQLEAEVLVPAGGRPRTVHEGNWRDLLDAAGRPRVPLVVEGANLFLTPGARTALSAAGVLLFKDSSANKCGVICSSYEIAAALLLDEPTILRVKDRLVDEVLDRLRSLARLEADVLLDEHRRCPDVPLPDLSVRLSRTILWATDTIARAVIALDPDAYALLEDLVRAHLPPVLVELAGADLLERLPPAYVEQTIACAAATRLVYREGLAYVEGLSEPDLARLAVDYLRADREVAQLADRLDAQDDPAAAEAARILRQGGARAAVTLRHRTP
ncbi:MAG: hypothetical protein H6732_06780 [Alphaproteobacteria bacterium]|nr:hypothetical protein [Alphaproteobacteria bacterium]